MHRSRPLKGQQESAANVWRLLEGSAIIESHRWCDKVQDAYSLRCAPQVHGACRDLLDYVEATVTVELNAATDNPLVLARRGRDRLGRELPRPAARVRARRARDGGRRAREHLRAAHRAAREPDLSDGLPPFLVEEGGLNSGFMIPQYVAAALVSENKVLAHPASVDSIPTSAGQEDHVSMGNAAGLKALQRPRQRGARARDRAARRRAGDRVPRAAAARRRASRAVHDVVRTLSPRLVEDRSLGARHRARRRSDPLRRASLAAAEAEVGALA